MSGAPVFDASGSVVGMVRGGQPSSSTVFVLPVQLLKGLQSIALAWKTSQCKISAMSSSLSLYVVDFTQRMGRPDKNGWPLFEVIKSQLVANFGKLDSTVDCFGGVAFGGKMPAQWSGDDCERVSVFYPIGNIDPPRLSDALKPLQPGARKGPLVAAIIRTLQMYQPYRKEVANRPDIRFSLTIVTSGPDTCGSSTPKQFIDALTRNLSERELREVYYDNRMFSIMLRLASADDVDARAFMTTLDYEQPDQPLAILIIHDTNTLASALGAIAELSSSNERARSHGCGTLLELFGKQGDEAGIRKIRRRCG